jgi:methyl-accepting chemotaxis protein
MSVDLPFGTHADMMKKIQSLSISWKLPLMIVGAGGLVGICIGIAAYWNAYGTLGAEAEIRLDALLETRKASLDDYLGSIEEDLRFVASNPMTKDAVIAFRDGWRDIDGDPEEALQRHYITENPHPTGSKDNLDAAADGSSYSNVHGKYHPWFRQFLRERGYYDIFLFNLEGDLIYTVFKELDYATNLVEGKYQDTDLGNAFRAARDNATPNFEAFFDFRPYAPSHGAPASFISTPILGDDGRALGVLVFQMPIDRLNAVVQQTAGLGETGQTYLVGADRLMRTNSRFSEESTILAQSVDNAAVQAALRGDHGIVNSIGLMGNESIIAHTFLDFNGTRWAMLAEIAYDEIMAPASVLARNLIAITLAALAGLAALGSLLSRDVTQPLVAMVNAVNNMAKGDNVTIPGVDRGDEIGSVSRSIELISQKGLEAARLRSALDASNTMVMVANRRGEIVYVNPCLMRMLKSHETAIRQDVPNFNSGNILGSSFDIFHKNPAHNRGVVDGLSSNREVNILVGGRRLRLAVSPVTNESNTRIGTVVEWADKTEDLSIQDEIRGVISAARDGDFNRKVQLEAFEGVYRELGDGMNELVTAVAAATDDLGTMFAALADGDLSRRITNDYQGKFGELKDNANRTADQLSSIVGQIQTATSAVHNAASEIATGTNDLSQRTEQAASNLEETAASTEEMSATVRQNAENSKEANVLASTANDTASKGGDVVQRAVVAMSGIEDSAQKITDIIGVIDEIAFQTNLLALNASVEAARAGEAGKGFAVVAQEVRQLAQRSAQAASDIKTLIQNSNGQVKDGVKLVNEAGGALGEIVESIGKVAGIIQSISSASQEQALGVQEINSSVASMDEMTQQNSALVEESTAAARNLTDQATQLAELMAFFKLDGAAGKMVRPQPRAVPKPAPAPAKPTPASVGGDDGWDEF